MDIKADITRAGIKKEEIDKLKSRIDDEYRKLRSGKIDMTGWVNLPFAYSESELAHIIDAAAEIKKKCSILIVIGIGGSYLGTRAVTEAIGARGSIGLPEQERDGSLASWINDGVNIIFAGNNFSAAYHLRILREFLGNDVCLCVVSKSGETMETKAAFAMLKAALETKYSEEEVKERIYVITGKSGSLRREAEAEGYKIFDIGEDVGGRYSVLTAAGLLPIAASGPNIKEFIVGAKDASEIAEEDPSFFDYAAVRYLLGQKKTAEVFEYYEPQLSYFAEWLKQLFGESEGKDGKGIFPVSLSMSADLHSMGQFIQDGSRVMFETVVDIQKPKQDFFVKDDPDNLDGLNFLSNQNMSVINHKALEGTVIAHTEGGTPNMILEIPEMNEFELGYLIYFFEKACAVSGYLLGVNPFDQPGVESYKKNMFALLGKPGYESEKEALLEKLK